MTKITSFKNGWNWLSNFFPCVCVYEGDVYPSSEHAYQAAKFPKGHEARKTIAAMITPGATKKFAKTFSHAHSKDFHERKQQVMLDVLRSKFLMNRDLQDKLLATMNPEAELIEGNTWGDAYWGVCNGQGENHLGKLLMRVRSGLFLWQMAGIYPGDPDGSLNKEACELLGIPYTPSEITVTFTDTVLPDRHTPYEKGRFAYLHQKTMVTDNPYPKVDKAHADWAQGMADMAKVVAGFPAGTQCHSNRDGECDWDQCPQNRDGEPKKTSRHCPLDIHEEEN